MNPLHSTSIPPEGVKQCLRCKRILGLLAFPLKTRGVDAFKVRVSTCKACSDGKKASYNQKKVRSGTTSEPGLGAGVLSIAEFLALIQGQGGALAVEACVQVSNLGSNLRQRADLLAEHIWARLGYRFIYHSNYPSRQDNGRTARLTYNCAQSSKRAKKSVKSPDAALAQRGRDTFQCGGWLRMLISQDLDVILIKMTHQMDHAPYCSIDIPGYMPDHVHQYDMERSDPSGSASNINHAHDDVSQTEHQASDWANTVTGIMFVAGSVDGPAATGLTGSIALI